MGDKSIPVSLQEDGVLWAINRVLFHPRGFALNLDPDTGRFGLQWDGSEPGTFTADVDDERFRQFEDLLQRAKVNNG